MTPSSFLERCEAYRRTMTDFMDRMARGPVRLHVPKRIGLRRPQADMLFHLTPELFLQAGGATDFCCPTDRFPLRAGELALIPRGVPHSEWARDVRGSRFRGLVMCFQGNDIRLIATKTGPDRRPAFDFTDAFTAVETAQAIRYLDDASAALSATSPVAETRRRALVFAALSVIFEIVEPGRRAGRGPAHHGPNVRQARDRIQARLHDPALSVALLARQVGCSADHLSRCFREETGASVLAYLREERLSRAKALMQDSKLNISEIAWACGFSSLNYFVRVFRQATGKPPRTFRRSLNATEGDELK